MRGYIDTNIFIFLCGDMDELDPEVKGMLEDYENSFIISSESIKEIGTLIKNRKVGVKEWKTFADVKESARAHDIEVRYVDESHLKTFYKLDPADGHSDPADLMIIAQAITEGIHLISSDTKFPLYEKQGLKFILNRRNARSRRNGGKVKIDN